MSEIVLFYLAISSTKLYKWNCVVLFGYLQYKALLVELCCFIRLSPVQGFMSGIVLFYLAISSKGFISGILLFYLAISSARLYEWNCVVLFGYLQCKAL